jgi:hypothetical protein
MKVPFIYDSSDRWIARRGNALDDWDWLYFRKNTDFQSQFTGPSTKDSLLYLNGTPSRLGFDGIKGIYFKKIKMKLVGTNRIE